MSALGKRRECRRCHDDDVEFDTELGEWWCATCDDWAL